MNRCIKCGNKFSPSRSDQLFCSKRCRYKYYHSSDLILTLKKQWFDMILSGEKKEEYREIKPYWTKRFENYFGKHWDTESDTPSLVWDTYEKTIVFKNGYGNDVPTFSARCTISENVGKPEWGAEAGKIYYVLKIVYIL